MGGQIKAARTRLEWLCGCCLCSAQGLLSYHPPQALGTIYELLYTKEYRDTVCWAFSGILLGLLTELYYLLEMGLVQGMFDYQEDDLGSKPLGPCR